MKIYKQSFNNLSISKKFTLSLFGIVIIPLIITFLFINRNITQHINAQNYKINLEILKQTKTPLVNIIKDIEFISLNILGNDKLQEFIKTYEREEVSKVQRDTIEIKYDIQSLLDSREYISSVSVYDENNILFQFGKLVMNENEVYMEATNQLKGQILWTPAYINESYLYHKDRIYEIALMRTINDLYVMDRGIGYERISIDEEYICNLYEGISTEATENILIVDKYGNIVSSMNKDLLGDNISSTVYFNKLFKEKEGYFIEGSNLLISYYVLDSPEWSVVKIDNLNLMWDKNKLGNSIIFLCLTCSLLFGICFLYIQNKSIIIPVEELSIEVSKFREGNYNIQRHTYAKDEIGTLNECFIDMGIYIQDLIEREYKSRLREKETELKSLQSYINPHFLYNTLEAIRWMAIKDKQSDIARQIEALSQLFRHTLNGGEEMTTIGEEITHLKNYIVIQKNRFGDNLEVSIEVEDKLYAIKTLKLILQPLVENAIVHGLENKIGGGKIIVNITECGEGIKYSIQDNGLGADENKINEYLRDKGQSSNVFALNNINERIKHKYGEGYGIQFKSQVGIGTTVEVILPKEVN